MSKKKLQDSSKTAKTQRELVSELVENILECPTLSQRLIMKQDQTIEIVESIRDMIDDVRVDISTVERKTEDVRMVVRKINAKLEDTSTSGQMSFMMVLMSLIIGLVVGGGVVLCRLLDAVNDLEGVVQ